MDAKNASLYNLIRAALIRSNVTGESVDIFINRRIVAFTNPGGLLGIGYGATDAERAEIEADWFLQREKHRAMMAA